MILASKIISLVMSCLMLLTGGLNMLFNGDIYKPESVDSTIGLSTFAKSQGITNDGESWYFSGKKILLKQNIKTGKTEAINLKPFKGLEDLGVKHMGGISYYNGLIYVAMEDSKVWNSPTVALFDAETLEFTGKYNVFDTEILFRGCPWVCCDAERKCIYVGNSRNAVEIYSFDIETFEFIKTIPLDREVKAIQGAEMYNGKIIAATNDATRAVYEIDPDTGSYEKLFDRIMYEPKLIDNFGGEGEGITVLEMEDGTVFHALNLGTLFIDANLRHYKPAK